MFFSFPKPQIIEKEQRKLLLRRVFTRVFLDDWLMKLVALVITLTLWLGVTGLQAPTTTRLRGVTLNLLIANDLEITNSPVTEVDLVIRGLKQRVDQILPRDVAVTLDLSDIGKGDRTVQITPQNIKVDLPNGVEVVEVQPNKIAIKLEEVQEIEVPIRVETEGAPAPGYELYSTRVTPDTVRVRGPESFVKALTFVTTDKVDLNRATNDFSVQQIPLTVVNPKITLVSAATANVAVHVGRKRIERLIVVPYETVTRRGRASITLFGPSDVLEKLAPGDITIVQESDEDGRSQLRVILPPDLEGDVEVRDAKFRE
jgi:YbbR domain-containing protein